MMNVDVLIITLASDLIPGLWCGASCCGPSSYHSRVAAKWKLLYLKYEYKFFGLI